MSNLYTSERSFAEYEIDSKPVAEILSFIRSHSNEITAVFLHSSIVLENARNLSALWDKSSYWVKYYLPENSYYELRLLEEHSTNDIIRRKAANILALVGTTIAKTASHKTMCDNGTSGVSYDAGLFVFYEVAAATEFSRRFNCTGRDYILSYAPYQFQGSCCQLAEVGKIPYRMCTPLQNMPVASARYTTLSVVNADKREVCKLQFSTLESVGMGGESEIFKSPQLPGKLIKLYTAFVPGKHMEHKLRYFMSLYGNGLNYCAFPTELIYSNGQCVGFVMDLIKGDTFIKVLYSKRYEEYSYKIELILKVSAAFVEARINQVVFADPSLRNIMLDSNGHIAFIDADSMEFSQYPGGGYTNPFGHPNIKIGDAYNRLRTFEEGNFSYAVLLFIMLLGWDNPLSQGGIDGEPDWKAHKFPFSTKWTGEGCVKYGVTVDPSLLDEWKAQPASVRKGFEEVFEFKATYDVGEWLACLKIIS